MPPRKKPTGQMPPRKIPGKIPPTYNAFWKRIPLENAFEQNTPGKISTRNMPPWNKNSKKYFLLRKNTPW